MGRDIHAILEVHSEGRWRLADALVMNDDRYDPGDPEWIPVEVEFGRPRELFDSLEDFVASAEHADRRGLPKDASAEVKDWAGWWGDDAFSHGWMLLSEFKTVTGWWYQDFDRLAADLNSVRLVFWFDH